MIQQQQVKDLTIALLEAELKKAKAEKNSDLKAQKVLKMWKM